MQSIRFRFAVLVAVAAPILALGGITIVSTSAHECQDPATDTDIEYAGDVDVWCTVPRTAPTVNPAPALAPAPNPTPTSLPTPGPPPVAGTFPVAYFLPDFTGPATRQFNQQFISEVADYLHVVYPAGSSAPSSGVPGGAQARLPQTIGPVDNATLKYRVRFPLGFQWVKGGKMPGLCGGQCWTGSNNGPGGWAARFMWRANGVGEVLLNDANTTGYGIDLGRYTGNWNWQADDLWHTVGETVHMNTPGASDGWIEVRYDGALVGHFGGLMLRGSETTTHIDSLMFSTFYGGHDSTWAPTVDMYLDFAAFHVSP